MRANRWRDSWVGRTIRRLGRIGIASMAAICGLAAFGLVLTVLAPTEIRRGPVYVAGVLGLAVAGGVFAALNKLGLVPDDQDQATVLDLRGR